MYALEDPQCKHFCLVHMDNISCINDPVNLFAESIVQLPFLQNSTDNAVLYLEKIGCSEVVICEGTIRSRSIA